MYDDENLYDSILNNINGALETLHNLNYIDNDEMDKFIEHINNIEMDENFLYNWVTCNNLVIGTGIAYSVNKLAADKKVKNIILKDFEKIVINLSLCGAMIFCLREIKDIDDELNDYINNFAISCIDNILNNSSKNNNDIAYV